MLRFLETRQNGVSFFFFLITKTQKIQKIYLTKNWFIDCFRMHKCFYFGSSHSQAVEITHFWEYDFKIKSKVKNKITEGVSQGRLGG